MRAARPIIATGARGCFRSSQRAFWRRRADISLSRLFVAAPRGGRNVDPCESRSDGPWARPRCWVAKPIHSKMPSGFLRGERRRRIGHCWRKRGEGWRHTNIEQWLRSRRGALFSVGSAFPDGPQPEEAVMPRRPGSLSAASPSRRPTGSLPRGALRSIRWRFASRRRLNVLCGAMFAQLRRLDPIDRSSRLVGPINTDGVAALAQAGERGPHRVRQPAGGGDKLGESSRHRRAAAVR